MFKFAQMSNKIQLGLRKPTKLHLPLFCFFRYWKSQVFFFWRDVLETVTANTYTAQAFCSWVGSFPKKNRDRTKLFCVIILILAFIVLTTLQLREKNIFMLPKLSKTNKTQIWVSTIKEFDTDDLNAGHNYGRWAPQTGRHLADIRNSCWQRLLATKNRRMITQFPELTKEKLLCCLIFCLSGKDLHPHWLIVLWWFCLTQYN